MDKTVRNYVLAALIPIIVAIALILIVTNNEMDILMSVASLALCVPIIVMGLYMYLEGRGSKWINGVDWSRFSETERQDAAAYIGIYMAIGSLVLLISMNMLLGHMAIGFCLMFVAVAFMVIPSIRLFSNHKPKPRKEFTADRKVCICAAFLCISLVAVFGLGLNNESPNGVDVNLGEDSFTVKAPMFDHTFDYGAVEELELDPDFDKGSRVSGYGTSKISSGKFKNAQFGKYQLASYTQIQPCVWIKYDGEYYAFNESSSEGTQALYDQLKTKTGL